MISLAMCMDSSRSWPSGSIRTRRMSGASGDSTSRIASSRVARARFDADATPVQRESDVDRTGFFKIHRGMVGDFPP